MFRHQGPLRHLPRSLATCCLALSLAGASAVVAHAQASPGPPYPGPWPDPALDSPLPFAMVDAGRPAAVPGIVNQIIYNDSAQGSSGSVTFYSVRPDGPFSGEVASTMFALRGRSDEPGRAGLLEPQERYSINPLFIPRGGWIGFSQDAPIVGYTRGDTDAGHVLFDTRPEMGPDAVRARTPFLADTQNYLNYQFAVTDWKPATHMYGSGGRDGRVEVYFATQLRTDGNRPEPVPDNFAGNDIIITPDDPSVVLTDCNGNPTAHPAPQPGPYRGVYMACIEGGSGDRVRLTVSDAYTDSGIEPRSFSVLPAQAAAAAPGAAFVGTAKAKGTSLRFPVACRAGSRCAASVRLTTLRVSEKQTAGGTVTRSDLVKIGRGATSVNPRRKKTLTVGLNGAGRKALAAEKKLRVIAEVALTVKGTTRRFVKVVTLRR